MQHKEVPRLGVNSELQLPATATATPDPNHVWDLRYSSWHCCIFNPLNEARNWTGILVDTSRVYYQWVNMGTSQRIFKCLILLTVGATLHNLYNFVILHNWTFTVFLPFLGSPLPRVRGLNTYTHTHTNTHTGTPSQTRFWLMQDPRWGKETTTPCIFLMATNGGTSKIRDWTLVGLQFFCF